MERLMPAEKLPKPQGFKILISLPVKDAKTAGGIYIPEATRDVEQTASMVGNVVAMGNLAYQDADKFPNGPYCTVGDWVMFRAYSGTRFKVDGAEYRLINDDTVEAVVDDPGTIQRA